LELSKIDFLIFPISEEEHWSLVLIAIQKSPSDKLSLSTCKLVYLDSIQESCDYITNFFKMFFSLNFNFPEIDQSNLLLKSMDYIIEKYCLDLNNDLKLIYPIVII